MIEIIYSIRQYQREDSIEYVYIIHSRKSDKYHNSVGKFNSFFLIWGDNVHTPLVTDHSYKG